MNTLIFRTIAPYLTALMLIFSLFVLLRGHNEPGGGFIGGLIAASAIAIYGIANGVAPVRRALKVQPIAIAAWGLLLAGLSGLPAFLGDVAFMTAFWWEPTVAGETLVLSTVLLFDIGVYFVVLGAILTIALSLAEPNLD